MLQYLKPISEKHSIGRVIATFYLAQEILKLESFFNELKEDESFKAYQRKSLLKTKKIFIDRSNINMASSEQDEVIGFTFEKFNDDGRLKDILIIQNEPEHNRALLSFETRLYTRWINFFENLRIDLQVIFKKNYLFVKAVKLNYIDEFIWIRQDKIPVHSIFNAQSELINKKFLSSENGTILMLSQNKELNIEERTEISFNNRLKRITINHTYISAFHQIYSSKEVLAEDLLYQDFMQAHESNKDMLKDLLLEDVKKVINLN